MQNIMSTAVVTPLPPGYGPATSSNAISPAPKIVAGESIEWHEFHCDPIQDVVLCSKEGVYCRASSFALKRESCLFRDMLANIPNSHMPPSNAIPLDFSIEAISLFLDQYAAPSAISHTTTNFAVLHEYRKLVHYLDCDRLKILLAGAYVIAYKDKPLELLRAASQDDDLGNAKIALLRCGEMKEKLDSAVVFEVVSAVRELWHLPLLKCLLHSHGYHGTPTTGFTIQWPTLAKVELFVREASQAKLASMERLKT
ncbi:uncharacterized protein MKK02DRAFT_33191 [Dioszegia hungarica]|uniref:BTB domain-containing protein n=1 Tax=Dioszegia hungarica TaxID=4972 RepID=A0AA38LUS1_9TREE|nr:uncharacterized protein MKK02DRAFT_33191 [Dioszegia hungarica]KAI9635863.1 hypothetical protein MKK02DRAFT_33191 [Dioszegia hungarica]